MKKRVYFIVASIMSFLLSIYSILVADNTVKTMIEDIKEAYKAFPQSFQDRIVGMYETSGAKVLILFALVVAILNIFVFIIAKNNTILKHKGYIITYSVLSFVFTNMLFVQLLAISSFIIILCSKRKNPEDFPDRTKKEIPKIEYIKPSTKDIILGIILLVIYFSQFTFSLFLPDDFLITMLFEIFFNIIMICLCIIVFYNQLKYSFKIFKDNFKAYIKFIMARLGIAYLLLYVFSIISMMITKNATSVNQQTLESLPVYYIVFGAVIYAPLVEEIIFRGVIRRFIKNKMIFIIVSAIIFGLLHTTREATLVNVIVAALPYASLGACLASTYTKSNNIFTNITMHMIINTIATIFMILL